MGLDMAVYGIRFSVYGGHRGVNQWHGSVLHGSIQKLVNRKPYTENRAYFPAPLIVGYLPVIPLFRALVALENRMSPVLNDHLR